MRSTTKGTSDLTSWPAGWYVSDDVTIGSRVELGTGEVHLILADGKTLTANRGIHTTDKTLTIYGQSGQTGKLVANGYDNGAGIGGNLYFSSGVITINGGVIEATSSRGSAAIGGETTELTFSTVTTSLKAGKPYLVKWETTDDPIVEPAFADVVVKTLTAADTVVSIPAAAVEFIGYCSSKLITPANPEIYYMTSGNTLKHTGVNRTLRACRAYFRFTDEASVTGARQFVLNFDGDETTGIAEMGHEREDVSNAGDWYTVNGVKIEKPVRKGLYIRNGKKEIVK